MLEENNSGTGSETLLFNIEKLKFIIIFSGNFMASIAIEAPWADISAELLSINSFKWFLSFKNNLWLIFVHFSELHNSISNSQILDAGSEIELLENWPNVLWDDWFGNLCIIKRGG